MGAPRTPSPDPHPDPTPRYLPQLLVDDTKFEVVAEYVLIEGEDEAAAAEALEAFMQENL